MLSGNTPFIVKSRGNNELIQNLKKDKDPILFDGLHTTYILNLSDFKRENSFKSSQCRTQILQRIGRQRI